MIPWEAVQSALLPFITSLSSGDQLAIITYDQFEAELNLPITDLTEDNRPLLHAAIPRRSVPNQHLTMEACHQCGLDIASRLVFQDDNVQVQPILIVRSGKVSKEHREQFRQLAPIVIGLDRTLDRSWSEFSSKIHVIEQCAEKRLCQAYIAHHLIEAAYYDDYRLKLHVPHSVGSTKKTVNVSPSTKALIVISTAEDERDIASLSLTSPSGKIFTYSFYTHNMAYLRLSEDQLEPGIWQIHCQMYSDVDTFTLDVLDLNEDEHERPLEAWTDLRMDRLGMISHKMSLITIFGHKPFRQKFHQNLTFFTKKNFNSL